MGSCQQNIERSSIVAKVARQRATSQIKIPGYAPGSRDKYIQEMREIEPVARSGTDKSAPSLPLSKLTRERVMLGRPRVNYHFSRFVRFLARAET